MEKLKMTKDSAPKAKSLPSERHWSDYPVKSMTKPQEKWTRESVMVAGGEKNDRDGLIAYATQIQIRLKKCKQIGKDELDKLFFFLQWGLCWWIISKNLCKWFMIFIFHVCSDL